MASCVSPGEGDSKEESGFPSAEGGDGKESDDGRCKPLSFEAGTRGDRGREEGDSSSARGRRRAESGEGGHRREARRGVKDVTRKAGMGNEGTTKQGIGVDGTPTGKQTCGLIDSTVDWL